MLVGWELIDTKCLGWAGPRESQWECEVEMWAVGSPLGGGRWALVAGWRTTGGRLKVLHEYLLRCCVAQGLSWA